jgi:hypothetical protein
MKLDSTFVIAMPGRASVGYERFWEGSNWSQAFLVNVYRLTERCLRELLIKIGAY